MNHVVPGAVAEAGGHGALYATAVRLAGKNAADTLLGAIRFKSDVRARHSHALEAILDVKPLLRRDFL